jgi:hypothetical protein
MAFLRNESGNRKLGRAQECVLRMCNPEYPVRTISPRTLRTLRSLEDRGLAYVNFGLWRLTAEGEELREKLEWEDGL